MATLDYGVIAELINIPEDNTGRRFLTSLLASLGINVAAMVGVSIASQLHEPDNHPTTTVVAEAQEWSFESPKLTPPEAKPIAVPLPKHRPEKIKRTIHKTAFKKKQAVPDTQQETPQPTPAPALETPEEKPLELPTETTTTKTAPTVAASAERVGSVAPLVAGGNNLSSATVYRPTEISRRVGVSEASGAVVRGGNSGFSPSASGTNFMATISLAAPVRGHGPTIRSATLLPASQGTLTAAVSDEGRMSPALSAGSDSGARGSAITAVSGGGEIGVRGAFAGKAGVAGSRAIGIGSVAVSAVSVSGTSTGTGRGPATGPGRLTESTGHVGSASETERGSGISAGSGNTMGAGRGSIARTGGGGGPQGQAGRAGSGGSGGSAAQASEGGVARVDTKQTNNTLLVVNQGATVASSSNSPTKRNEDAERTSDPDPELTPDMKKGSLNLNLRVRVTVDTDGSHSEELIQGSGDRDVDQLVLKTMRRWKWRPALRDGEKAQQTLTFRYKISIN
ncbi:TonB family protein [Armatimonas sp.]|uniref:TonB family protein n=1 Tax=Armatimonas sp. TaxID=1872638 RepID=UPI00374DA7F7